ncbi:unnamed protein product [Phytophthora fragariaefolia]|uniref:Unnamed protein product n=1 Tax=Phytophthora fragariaefolia TaxID=1490495 RepID=A0A9W7D3E8_9STRA|nr:unnamed protein product [Phytophthora fragariaefolia]
MRTGSRRPHLAEDHPALVEVAWEGLPRPVRPGNVAALRGGGQNGVHCIHLLVDEQLQRQRLDYVVVTSLIETEGHARQQERRDNESRRQTAKGVEHDVAEHNRRQACQSDKHARATGDSNWSRDVGQQLAKTNRCEDDQELHGPGKRIGHGQKVVEVHTQQRHREQRGDTNGHVRSIEARAALREAVRQELHVAHARELERLAEDTRHEQTRDRAARRKHEERLEHGASDGFGQGWVRVAREVGPVGIVHQDGGRHGYQIGQQRQHNGERDGSRVRARRVRHFTSKNRGHIDPVESPKERVEQQPPVDLYSSNLLVVFKVDVDDIGLVSNLEEIPKVSCSKITPDSEHQHRKQHTKQQYHTSS